MDLRQSDAWLPSEATRRALLQVSTSPETVMSFTLPGLMAGETGSSSDPSNNDPYRALLMRYHKLEEVDAMRTVVTVDSVSMDLDGLRQLIMSGWHRAALDLTTRLLTDCGHGLGNTGQPCARLTPYSAQLWLLRFILLKQTRQYELIERELAAFSFMDAPDVYFEYSPNTYPNRKGSIIPFSMRLLHADLPRYLYRSSEAFERLYYLLVIVGRLISNLENGYTEDGEEASPSEEYKASSLSLWLHRKCRILSCCLSIYISESDYPSAISTIDQMIELMRPMNEHHPLLASRGRICLMFGDVVGAKWSFGRATTGLDHNLNHIKSQRATFEALLLISDGKFEEAKRMFRKAVEFNDSNIAAANSLAVCSLYLGQLEEAIGTLESMVVPISHKLPPFCAETSSQKDSSSSPCIHDTLVSNLAYLYEIESDVATSKKVRLLQRLATLPGEPVDVHAFKLAL